MIGRCTNCGIEGVKVKKVNGLGLPTEYFCKGCFDNLVRDPESEGEEWS